MILDEDNRIKRRILDLINEFRRSFYEATNTREFQKTKEEEVKSKFIFPLFETLGWNMYARLDSEMEYNCGYDTKIYQSLLKEFPTLMLKQEDWDHEYIADCVFKVENKPYIFLEAKNFQSFKNNLPSVKEPFGFRIVENARKYPETKYVVFTNFLKMAIIDVKSTRQIVFQDISEYISKYDNLKILLKAQVEHSVGFAKKRECFENYGYIPKECDNCVPIQRYLCEATTKIKQLGYELEPIQ